MKLQFLALVAMFSCGDTQAVDVSDITPFECTYTVQKYSSTPIVVTVFGTCPGPLVEVVINVISLPSTLGSVDKFVRCPINVSESFEIPNGFERIETQVYLRVPDSNPKICADRRI